jgi:hypothetical protein
MWYRWINETLKWLDYFIDPPSHSCLTLSHTILICRMQLFVLPTFALLFNALSTSMIRSCSELCGRKRFSPTKSWTVNEYRQGQSLQANWITGNGHTNKANHGKCIYRSLLKLVRYVWAVGIVYCLITPSIRSRLLPPGTVNRPSTTAYTHPSSDLKRIEAINHPMDRTIGTLWLSKTTLGKIICFYITSKCTTSRKWIVI